MGTIIKVALGCKHSISANKNCVHWSILYQVQWGLVPMIIMGSIQWQIKKYYHKVFFHTRPTQKSIFRLILIHSYQKHIVQAVWSVFWFFINWWMWTFSDGNSDNMFAISELDGVITTTNKLVRLSPFIHTLAIEEEVIQFLRIILVLGRKLVPSVDSLLPSRFVKP